MQASAPGTREEKGALSSSHRPRGPARTPSQRGSTLAPCPGTSTVCQTKATAPELQWVLPEDTKFSKGLNQTKKEGCNPSPGLWPRETKTHHIKTCT